MIVTKEGPVRARGESGYGYDQLEFSWARPKVRHPAKYSEALYPVFARMLAGSKRILDPMAGVGGVHRLMEMIPGCETYGCELEVEWSGQHERNQVGDALCLSWPDGDFDAICVSCCYGNRMSDHHEAKDSSHRNTYRHALGRPLDPQNAGMLQFGEEYKSFHRRAWAEVVRVLCSGGRFVLDVKNFIRKGELVDVVGWHTGALTDLGLREVEREAVLTPGNRYGANGSLRVDHEVVVLFQKPVSYDPKV